MRKLRNKKQEIKNNIRGICGKLAPMQSRFLDLFNENGFNYDEGQIRSKSSNSSFFSYYHMPALNYYFAKDMYESLCRKVWY